MSASYPTRSRRTALAPGILAAITLLIGVAIITTDGFTVVRYVVSILALIVSWFAWQAKQWWWIIGLVPVAVLWNPVYVIDLSPIDLGMPDLWLGLQYGAVLLFLAAGILIRIADPDARPTPKRR